MIATPKISAPVKVDLSDRMQKLLLVFAMFVVLYVLYAPSMAARLPGLDESAYLHRGALLIEQGKLHSLADNPAPTLVNGAIYPLFHAERIQLEKVSTVRRWLTLFLLLSGTFYAAIRSGMSFRFAAITALLTGTSPTIRFVLKSSSDALYAVFLIFSFGWAVGEIRNIQAQSPSRPAKYAFFGWLLSALALSRNDGLIVGFCALLFLGLALKQAETPIVAIRSRLLSAATAFCLPLLLWCLLTGLQTGDWSTHIPERSYFAFSQGQNILFAGQFIDMPNNPTAESLFGSAQQNGNSIVRAIVRHPKAFAERAKRLPSNIKASFVGAYGGKAECAISVGFLFFGIALAIIGRDKRFHKVILLLSMIYLLPLAVYLLTFYRPGYFAMNYPVLSVLSMAGVSGWLLANHSALRRNAVVLLLLCIFLLNCVQAWREEKHSVSTQASDTTSERHWISELRQTIPANTTVIAVDPSQLWYAHLEHFDDPDLFLRAYSPLQLRDYMRVHQLKYLVLDHGMRQFYPRFANVVETSGLQPLVKDSDYGATLYSVPLK